MGGRDGKNAPPPGALPEQRPCRGKFWRLADASRRECALLAGFGLLGAGWEGLHLARAQGSPLIRFGDRISRLDGSLTSDPQPGTIGWTATFRVNDVLVRGGPMTNPIRALRLHENVWLEGRGQTPKLSTQATVFSPRTQTSPAL